MQTHHAGAPLHPHDGEGGVPRPRTVEHGVRAEVHLQRLRLRGHAGADCREKDEHAVRPPPVSEPGPKHRPILKLSRRGKETEMSLSREPLTVDVDVAADVGAAQGVGDLAGDGLREEGVVHDDLVRVSGDLLDDASSLGPPGEDQRKCGGGD